MYQTVYVQDPESSEFYVVKNRKGGSIEVLHLSPQMQEVKRVVYPVDVASILGVGVTAEGTMYVKFSVVGQGAVLAVARDGTTSVLAADVGYQSTFIVMYDASVAYYSTPAVELAAARRGVNDPDLFIGPLNVRGGTVFDGEFRLYGPHTDGTALSLYDYTGAEVAVVPTQGLGTNPRSVVGRFANYFAYDYGSGQYGFASLDISTGVVAWNSADYANLVGNTGDSTEWFFSDSVRTLNTRGSVFGVSYSEVGVVDIADSGVAVRLDEGRSQVTGFGPYAATGGNSGKVYGPRVATATGPVNLTPPTGLAGRDHNFFASPGYYTGYSIGSFAPTPFWGSFKKSQELL